MHEYKIDVLVEAVTHYRHVYGHTLIPKNFICPPSWPCPGLDLGKLADTARTRQRHARLPPAHVERLNACDFAWVFNDYKWTRQILPALEAYARVVGNLLVQRNFIVPSDQSCWPRECWGRHLGKTVNNIRSRRRELSQDQRLKLDRIGFVWGVNDDDQQPVNLDPPSVKKSQTSLGKSERNRKKEPKKKASSSSVNSHVSKASSCPNYHHTTPASLRKSKKGSLLPKELAKVNKEPFPPPTSVLRPLPFSSTDPSDPFPLPPPRRLDPVFATTRTRHFSHDYLDSSSSSSEFWSPGNNSNPNSKVGTSGDPLLNVAEIRVRSVFLPALRTYRLLYGHLNVPSVFIVPHEEPWSHTIWGLNVGKVVGDLHHGVYRRQDLSCESLGELAQLGFHLWSSSSASFNIHHHREERSSQSHQMLFPTSSASLLSLYHSCSDASTSNNNHNADSSSSAFSFPTTTTTSLHAHPSSTCSILDEVCPGGTSSSSSSRKRYFSLDDSFGTSCAKPSRHKFEDLDLGALDHAMLDTSALSEDHHPDSESSTLRSFGL